MLPVSGLLLTIGEKSFPSSYQALKNQTAPLQELIVIRNVSPFSKAFNDGVTAVKTPFFIQCDADMILDPNCAEVLFSKMNDRTGMVVGLLRDPLQGRIRGVKLYRTECCQRFPLADSFNCEEIFRLDLLKHGWFVEMMKANEPTVGTHETDLTDSVYQFERFKFLGVKIHARRAWWDFAYRLIRLTRSTHQEVVPLAVSAMVCGIYITHQADHLKGYVESPEYRLFKSRFRNEEAPESDHRIYAAAGIYNFLFGYQDGILFIRRRKYFSLQSLIQNYLTSFQIQQWCYLLGFCASFMNPGESVFQNRISRFRRMKPFLEYLKRRLHHFDEKVET
jgi:hypothetical protein